MTKAADERDEPVDYAADARRLLRMLEERKGRRAIAVVPANSDCSPSQIKKAGRSEAIDASWPELGGFDARDGKG